MIGRLAIAAALLAPIAAQAETGRLLAYSGIFQDNYTDTVLKSFIGPNSMEFVGTDGSAGMLGQLRTQKTDPQVDVVIMDTTTAAIACAEGLVEPLTPEMLPVLTEISPLAREAGGKCGPGVTFDHLVISYDSTLVTPPPASLEAMWDPKWKGKVGLSAPPDIQGLALTAILANAATGNWRTPDQAFEKLKTLAPSVQTFTPQPDSYTLILNGTLAFATGWNARAQLYHDRSGGKLGVMLPSEGTAFQINTINLVKGGPHRAAGLAFIAHALSAPVQKAFTERMFYGPTNATAQIDPAAVARLTGKDAKIVPIDWNEMIKLREAWNQRWRREVIANSGR